MSNSPRPGPSRLGRAALLLALGLSIGRTAPPLPAQSSLPLLLSPAKLAEQIDASAADGSGLRIIDYRSRLAYLAGHIPGAVHIPRKVVYDTIDGVEGKLPPVASVLGYLRKAGISQNSRVVVYDGSDGLWASRFFWALELLGHRDVHLLNGGYRRWKREGMETSRSRESVPEGDFGARGRDRDDVAYPSEYVSTEWMLRRHGGEGITLLDARAPEEYTGEKRFSDRGGHIPRAVSIDWTRHLSEGEGSQILPLESLAQIYGSEGIEASADIVAYCQTGVRASHTYFVLRLLGYQKVRVYDNSWEVWGNRDDTPIEG